ncbi:MAG: MucR family transcriptional regulator [Alphaproteobacteria bacterium]
MIDERTPKTSATELLRMTADVVSAYVGNNTLSAAQIPDVIKAIYGSFVGLQGDFAEGSSGIKPVVPIKKSVTAEYIICLEDGKKLKMLKRHLRTSYSLTPDQYRTKWGLPPDYPMVAPNYAAQRSAFAKKIGLGRKPGKRRGRGGK